MLTIYPDWSAASWQHETVCLNALEAKAPRTGERCRDLLLGALQSAGSTTADLVGAASYHEGAMRKGLRLLGIPLLGCGCHALQLAPKHALRPLRERRSASAAAALASD